MNVFAKFDEIPSMILEIIKKTKRYGHTDGWSVGRTIGQRENSIPSHKHSLRGGIITTDFTKFHDFSMIFQLLSNSMIFPCMEF